MRPNDAKNLAQRLVEFFPGQLKPAEKQEAIRRFSEMEYAVVDRLIGEHWEKFKKFGTRLDLMAFFDACRAANDEQKRQPVNAENHEGSIADVYRRTDPQLRNVRSDIEVIIRTYRKRWYAAREAEHCRAPLKRECAMKLLGMKIEGLEIDLANAELWADTVFADVDHFRAVLADLRGDLPASARA